MALRDFDEAGLMEGDATIRISHLRLDCKDALALAGKAPVVRRFPMIPGIEVTGMMPLAGKLPATLCKKAGAAPRILL